MLAGVRRDADADALVSGGPEGLEPVILDITMETDVAAVADRVAAIRCVGPCGP
ncbi:hypothetical protein [Mycobacterium genavense]|uniref:hypothetical protein n=1 Tax=Mycobacterium genavense TaxID=36812 RepID=UPI0004B60B81|nr:hypothetical protein [Mycobacterium genavense]